MVFVGFGSNSRAGIIGLIVAFIIMGILFRKMIIQKPLHIVISFVVLVIVSFGLNKASEEHIIDELKNLSFTKDVENAQAENKVYLDDIIFDDYSLEIVTNDQDLHLEFPDLSIIV